MLIKCPECKKEISDRSNMCIHCGFPMNKMKNGICIINNTPYDFMIVLNKIQNNEPIGLVIRTIRDICNMSLSDSKKLYDYIIENHTIPESFECEIIINQSNQPKCPTCGSTNIEKISVSKKAFGGFLFGVFSSDVRNTMHCKNCGAKW